MATTVKHIEDAEQGRTITTTTLFDVIAALYDEGLDEQSVVPILGHMFARGQIKFCCPTAFTN